MVKNKKVEIKKNGRTDLCFATLKPESSKRIPKLFPDVATFEWVGKIIPYVGRKQHRNIVERIGL